MFDHEWIGWRTEEVKEDEKETKVNERETKSDEGEFKKSGLVTTMFATIGAALLWILAFNKTERVNTIQTCEKMTSRIPWKQPWDIQKECKDKANELIMSRLWLGWK